MGSVDTWAYLPVQATFELLESLDHSSSPHAEIFSDLILLVAHECLAILAATYQSLQVVVRMLPAMARDMFWGTVIAEAIPVTFGWDRVALHARRAATAAGAIIIPSSVDAKNMRNMSHPGLFIGRVQALTPGLAWASPKMRPVAQRSRSWALPSSRVLQPTSKPHVSRQTAPVPVSAPVPKPVLDADQEKFYGELCETIGLTGLATLEPFIEPVVEIDGS